MILPSAISTKFREVQSVSAIIFLAIATYLLHGSALNGFWRFDDGIHLAFATTYSPWQYFFVPEITRLQSGLFITPWNVLTYDINLSLFGLNPKGFYAHQLISLWLTSVATFYLLKLWVRPVWAVTGGGFLLLGAPTVYIAQELMSGHYLEGLLLSILALYAFVHSVRFLNRSSAVVGAIFYLLATSCKEVFVPLVGVLLFLPEGNLKTRFQLSMPYGMVALAYIPWRYVVLGKLIGGYDPELQGFDFSLITKTFANIPFLLFGNDSLGKIVLVMVTILLAVAIWKRAFKWTLIVIFAILLLLPLAPLGAAVSTAERFLFLPWWGTSIFLALLLAKWGETNHWLNVACALTLVGVLLGVHHRTEKTFTELADLSEKSYRFILNSESNQGYMAPDFNMYLGGVLPKIIKAEEALSKTGFAHAKIISDEDHLVPYINSKLNSVWRYSQVCHCVENITKEIPIIVDDYRNKLRVDTLSVRFNYQPPMLFWELGPYAQGEYSFVIDEAGKFQLPRRIGSLLYTRPEPLAGYVRYQSPDGWITRSPHFYIDPENKNTHQIRWSQ